MTNYFINNTRTVYLAQKPKITNGVEITMKLFPNLIFIGVHDLITLSTTCLSIFAVGAVQFFRNFVTHFVDHLYTKPANVPNTMVNIVERVVAIGRNKFPMWSSNLAPNKMVKLSPKMFDTITPTTVVGSDTLRRQRLICATKICSWL